MSSRTSSERVAYISESHGRIERNERECSEVTVDSLTNEEARVSSASIGVEEMRDSERSGERWEEDPISSKYESMREVTPVPEEFEH